MPIPEAAPPQVVETDDLKVEEATPSQEDIDAFRQNRRQASKSLDVGSKAFVPTSKPSTTPAFPSAYAPYQMDLNSYPLADLNGESPVYSNNNNEAGF